MSASMDWDNVVGSADDVRRVFDSLPTMMVAFQGRDHRVIAVNATSRAVFPKLGAIGHPVREVFPEVFGQYIFEMLDRVFETGEQQENREWRIELDLDDSGNVHEFFIDATVTARRGDDGKIDGIQALFEDATERVQTRLAVEARSAAMSQRYERARTSATVMQQALLASSVPVLPGFDVAAEYLVATEDTAAGGDWFDAIATEDGALFLIVGDVVGHGVEAAAVMAQLRTATRLQVLSGKSVTETIDVVEGFSKHVRGARAATVCIGRLDSHTGLFEYCTAGHPPPLLISDGAPRYAEPSGGGPLGSGLPHVAKIETLEVGDAVLFYTDGLIERPQRQLTASIAEFADVATGILAGGGFRGGDAQRPVERLCSQALEVLLRDGGYNDDVTLLAAQRTAAVSPLFLSVDTDAEPTPLVRDRLREWLADLGADAADAIVLEHAVSEYVDNAVQHAYVGRSGSVTIEGVLEKDATLCVSVADSGQWRPPDVYRPGRGLSMASTLIEGARVIRGSEGTRAEMAFPLSRPARLVTDPMIGVTPQLPSRSNTNFEIHTEPDGLIIIGGDIDALHAPLLAGRITGDSQAGTTPLAIDLSLVTHLGSAAVRVLADAHVLAQNQGAALTLIAPPGSTAHHILTMVGLPTGQ